MAEVWNADNPKTSNDVTDDVTDIEENLDYLMHRFGYRVDASAADQSASGTANTVAALTQAIGTTKNAVLFFPHHMKDVNRTTYTFSDDLDLSLHSNITFYIQRGAFLSIANTKTLDIGCNIQAGNYEIFTGAGTISLYYGDGIHNMSWFDGATLNARWDFLRRGLLNGRPYTVILRKPYANQNGSVEIATDLWYWDLTAPLQFDDPENMCTWIQRNDCRIRATAAMNQAMLFSPSNKTEDIVFPHGTWIDCNDNAAIGIEVQGVARLRFDGHTYITDVNRAFVINNTTAASGQIYIDTLYVARFDDSALEMLGSGDGCQGNKIRAIHAQIGRAAGAKCVLITGVIRNLEIQNITYQTTTDGAAADLNEAVVIQSNASGWPWRNIHIGQIFADDALKGLVCENSGGTTKINDLTVDHVSVTGVHAAADINYCDYATLGGFAEDNTLTIGNTCADVTVHANADQINDITDTGTRTQIMGYLLGQATWNPGALIAHDDEGAGVHYTAVNITVTGAVVGDFALVGFATDIVDLTLTASVTANDTVTAVLTNPTDGAVDLGQFTIYAKVIKR